MRFIGVGFIATATDFLVFNLALAGNGDPPRTHIVLANTLAFAVATLVGYTLNSRITWAVGHQRRLLVRYILVATAGALLYDAALVGLFEATQAEGYLALNAVKVAAVGVSATWNFFGFNYFVFRDREASLPSAAPGEARP
ncbi:MAG: GtrA family protein [Dehalococcoidia bacterium]